MDRAPPDRLRDLIDTILEALDERVDGAALAARAEISRFHFDRQVAAGLREAPASFRRRMLLERAAWRLGRAASVTEVGLEAGYESTEAFSRAFSRAFGVAPSRFAREREDFRLAAPNGIHFHPPAGMHLPGQRRRPTMDVTDRLLEHDQWLTQRLLEHAAKLPDAALDREIRPGHEVLCFDGPEPSVRQMLQKLVWTKEVWAAAIAGRDYPAAPGHGVAELAARHARAGAELIALARRIRDRNEWDDAFVDALCEPPVSFTFGSVVAHIITFNAHRRQVLIGALRELGVDVKDPADPIEWERLREAAR